MQTCPELQQFEMFCSQAVFTASLLVLTPCTWGRADLDGRPVNPLDKTLPLMASQPDVIEACLTMAASAAKTALEKSVDDAISALQLAETQSIKVADRDLIHSACQGLAEFRHAWASGYATHLLAEFRTPQPTPTPSPAAAAKGRLVLSLVDDHEVSQSIESARLLQHMLPPLEQSLPDLDKLISAALGLTRVQPDLNPLRPDIFAKCLLDLLYGVAAPPAITALWIKHLGVPLGRELSRVYERIVNLLELSNVRGASYRVLATPSSSPAPQPSQAAPANWAESGSNEDWRHQGMLQDTLQPDPAVSSHSFQDFLVRGTAQAHQSLTPEFRAQMHQELEALTAALDASPSAHMLLSDAVAHSGYADAVAAPSGLPPSYQHLPAVDRPQRAITETSALNTRVWGRYAAPRQRAIVHTQLKAEAQQVGQVMGLEVVRQLVNQVAQDDRLLAPVRESIVALEPALMRLSMVDPHFFGDEKHPGRLLMERVAQRSFKFNDEFSPEFNTFFKPLTQAFNALNGLGEVNAARFDTVLSALEKHWSAQDQAEATLKRDMLERMRFAEARQTQADEIAYELSTRADLDEVPGLVLDFLFGPWSLAMAHARLCDTRQQLDPEGLGAAVPDLLWSAKSRATIKQPAKLIDMIPGLLGKLHSGLQLLGTDPEECAPFFDGLMQLHQPVLKLRRMKSQRDALASSHGPLSETSALLDEMAATAPAAEPATAEQRRAKVSALPWMGKQEMAAAGFEDTLPTDHGELLLAEPPDDDDHQAAAPDAPQPSPAQTQPPVDAAEATDGPDGGEDVATPLDADALRAAQTTLAGLHAGDWVDLYSRRRWLRAQLTWASTKGTLFMFVSHGGQPHSMTKRSCERLIAARLLRPVNTRGVVAQALKAVVAQAANQPDQAQTA